MKIFLLILLYLSHKNPIRQIKDFGGSFSLTHSQIAGGAAEIIEM